ncbi:MAG: hypothetical protein LUG18_12690 [Candidatus Azobacteroides sp.]|nr:hypothetical protein [Candidatus Azobacteroides sp.]
MPTSKRFYSSLFILSVCTFIFAQNGTNSPYSRYGYGKLSDQTFGQSQAMGGIGYGLRTPTQINTLNPASYSAVDSLIFLFDFGLTLERAHMSDGVNKHNDFNGNFSYLAMQFRIIKRLGMSIGLKPFSSSGYNFGSKTAIDEIYHQESFIGTGTFSQIYAGLGLEIIKDRLSIGANAGYMFGTLTREMYLTFPDASSSTIKPNPVSKIGEIEAHDFYWETGIQYIQPINNKNKVIIGAVFSPKQKFSSRNSWTTIEYDANSSSGSSVLENDTTVYSIGLYMPMNIGVGFSYIYNNQLTVGGDVLFQKWSDVPYPESGSMTFKDRKKYALGIEYVKDPYTQRGYFKKVRYRLGGYYTDSYTEVENSTLNEFGITVGLGLPFLIRGRESMLNIGAEYVKISPKKNLINEEYFRIKLGVTFNEMWFQKRKID